MRASELTNKSVEELETELLGLLREQFSLRVQYASGQLNQTHQIRNARRNIARVKTVLNKKVGA